MEKSKVNSVFLREYQQCINQIDDFLEYRYKKYTNQEVRDIVVSYITELTEKLKAYN